MSRVKSQFLSALGTAFEIFKAISDAVIARGGNDDSLREVISNDKMRTSLAKVILKEGDQAFDYGYSWQAVVQRVDNQTRIRFNPKIAFLVRLKDESVDIANQQFSVSIVAFVCNMDPADAQDQVDDTCEPLFKAEFAEIFPAPRGEGCYVSFESMWEHGPDVFRFAYQTYLAKFGVLQFATKGDDMWLSFTCRDYKVELPISEHRLASLK